ncbi:MAG: hypothetical protein A2901_01170 [Elusimicrobia bacterium RIFCSPLOWO2_01_FULL_54_10]|nr:MAG: hypothetical protein A2901_01170 [Elusimicrobia bacterium RIFCSPLOWO2_01_FULL_54_10]
MAKNKNRQAHIVQSDVNPSAGPAGISSRGWKIIGAGAGIVIVGFIVLTFTDPAGQNWASNLSPFLILGGYGVIAAGILKK